MTTLRVLRPWSTVAISHLLDTTSCPVCEVDALVDRHCRNCGVEITDDLAVELWNASKVAAEALITRQDVLERVYRPAPAPVAAALPPIPQRMPASPGVNPGPVAAAPRSSATVQSVLAVAGAGLFAVSAIVFTFFNPDLTDRAMRSVIVGLITILFLGGAWLLARRKLQFSAEAVGGLGMVFVALDVVAFSELAPIGVSPWLLAAIGTLLSGAVMAVVSTRARIRSWLWISLTGLTVVPAMLGYAGESTLSATLGHLGAAFVALALLGATPVIASRFDGRIDAERTTLVTLQISATVLVLAQMWSIETRTTPEYWLTITAVLTGLAVLAALTARQLARTFWSALAGATAAAAAVSLPFAADLGTHDAAVWYLAVTPTAGAAALLALTVLVPRVRALGRHASLGGALAVAGASVLPAVLLAVLIGAVTVLTSLGGSDQGASGVLPPGGILAVVLGLGAMSAGLGAFSVLVRRAVATQTDATPSETATPKLGAATGSIAIWLAALAGLAFACLPAFPVWSRIAIALGLAVVVSVTLVALPRVRRSSLTMRLPLVLGSHFAVLLAVVSSQADETVTVGAGIAIVAAIAVLARTVPSPVRFLHVGVGYAFALFVFATALDQLGVGTLALLCLTTSLASIGAIGATFSRWVAPPAWYAILVVTSVPFLIGVVQVVFERSGWTALSTSLIFLLALALLVTRRPGLGIVLRAIAAGLLVPSLAVVVVCLGAQVLLGSASPMTLPVIAAIVALVLPGTGLIGSLLVRRGIGARDATAARIAVEASTLLTGAIAVVLALVRVAAGLPTTFIVLVIVGLGAAATSVWANRRYGWWVAAASFTGALWCLWALAGIDVLEPYLLPPSLVAATIGLILTARGSHVVPLYATGLIVAVAPILVVLAVFGTGSTALAPWRGYGLVAASWLLLGLGLMLGRGSPARAESLRGLRVPTLAVAIVAGAAGAIQGVRFGLGSDRIVTGGVPLILLCLGIGLAGALPAAAAARAIRSNAPDTSALARSRWLLAPAALYVAVATWTAIERDWFTIWAMWSLMLAYLVTVVVIAWRLRTRLTSLPPVWFIFAIAFVTAIVAWSPRDLRVEWFSLPLGLFLLAAGAVVLHAARRHPNENRERGGTVDSWPAAWNGSWSLLAPGIVTLLSASVTATFTDPQTWRAILVIVIALVAILVGSSLKLAAPFLIGIVVLPIENVLVFLVQIGRGIESMPWWITLAVVGAVLLIIAVTYERRAGEENSITDRLRDLR
ncbi:putative membrane protein [Mycetocola sp. CAN_C7]|uniref:SCO7613 C-terminal domain-containing membrane protein n=1 Tax=Mycetocola sp. CAN_C7 TaxID=2787724 RepID=UPI0018CB6DA9